MLQGFINKGKREQVRVFIRQAAGNKLFKKLEPLINNLEEKTSEPVKSAKKLREY